MKDGGECLTGRGVEGSSHGI